MLEVVATGPLTTVQDLGRPGFRALGVGSSGAADRPALALANRLVGNPEGAAALEVTLGGLRVRATAPVVVAVTGAPAPVRVGGTAAAAGGPLRLAAGEELHLDVPPAGLRSYVAVRGGLAVPGVLGSRSSDLLGRLGPDPLVAGDHLPVGVPSSTLPEVDLAPLPPVPAPEVEVVLRATPGPHADRFRGDAVQLTATSYRVAADSDRTGLRLEGPASARSEDAEIASCGLLPGAVQVPPDGRPILFLADAPATGGYPVIAVVREPDLAVAAQLRPGQPVRFLVEEQRW